MNIQEQVEENTCRICFEPQTDNNDRLISPCLCTGTQKYIHESCLQTWRKMQPFRAHQCDVCHFVFLLSYQIDPELEYWFITICFVIVFFVLWMLLTVLFRNKTNGFIKTALQIFIFGGLMFFLSHWALDYPFVSSILLLTGPISIWGLGPFLVALDGYFRGLPKIYNHFYQRMTNTLHYDQHVIDRQDIVVN